MKIEYIPADGIDREFADLALDSGRNERSRYLCPRCNRYWTVALHHVGRRFPISEKVRGIILCEECERGIANENN